MTFNEMKGNYICFLVFLLSCSSVFSQGDDVIYQHLFWGRYNLKFQVSEKWTPHFEVKERFYLSTLRQHQFITSTGMNYKFNENLSLTGALLYFELTLPQDPDAVSIERSRELRPFLAIRFRHHINSKLTFLSRFKPESRYRQRSSNAFTFRNIRLRMRTGFVYKLTPRLKTVLKEEILINLRSDEIRTVFDQNRLTAGINYEISDRFAFEAGYLNRFQQRTNSQIFVNKDIAYFTVFHNLKLY